MVSIYAKYGDEHYKVAMSPAMVRKYDNGALVSCGLLVPHDVKVSTLRSWVMSRKAVAVSRDEYQHSGCQSSCVRRGDASCGW